MCPINDCMLSYTSVKKIFVKSHKIFVLLKYYRHQTSIILIKFKMHFANSLCKENYLIVTAISKPHLIFWTINLLVWDQATQ